MPDVAETEDAMLAESLESVSSAVEAVAAAAVEATLDVAEAKLAVAEAKLAVAEAMQDRDEVQQQAWIVDAFAEEHEVHGSMNQPHSNKTLGCCI